MRQLSRESQSTNWRGKTVYDTGENVCWVKKEQAAAQLRKIKDLKYLIKIEIVKGMEMENLNFPKAKICYGVQQIWAITEDANHVFGMFPSHF